MACVVPSCQFSKNSSDKVSMHLFPDPMREPQRHLSWVKVINCERIFKFDPYVVFKRFRVCRNHFSSECFNGSCKKLLTTAVPSLYLSTSNPDRLKTKYQIYEQKIINLLKGNSINVEDDTLKFINIDDTQSQAHLITLPSSELKISYDEKLWNSAAAAGATTSEADEEAENEEFVLMEVVNDSQDQSQYTIVLPQQEPAAPKVLNYQKPVVVPKVTTTPPTKRIAAKQKPSIHPLSTLKLRSFQANFEKCPKNALAQSICTKANPFEIFSKKHCDNGFNHRIDLKIDEADAKEYWCHAAFKIMRLSLIKSLNVENVEFSQSHFRYWDTIERCYYFLSNIVDHNIDGQLLNSLLENPLNERKGHWSMFYNIINKHGIVPKQCYPKSFTSERLDEVLKSKLREYAKVIRDMISSKSSNAEIQIKVDEKMSEVFGITSILFGSAPEKFTWEFTDMHGKARSIGPITPVDFYEQYIKPHINIDNKITLISDPRSALEHGKSYRASHVGNAVGGRQTIFNNLAIENLIDIITKSIVNGEAVLASCNSCELNDFELQTFKHLCDISITSSLEKASKIAFRDCSRKQWMVVSAIETDRAGKLVKLKLEKFAAKESKFFAIPKDSVSGIISEIVVDKRFVPNELLSATDPIPLEPFDPLTSLAL